MRQFYEIADGLAYLHSQKIVHTDMKPVRNNIETSRAIHYLKLTKENVFIDESRHACISDFGSGFIGENTTGKLTEMSPAWTRFWIPPEYLRPEGLDDDEIEDDTWIRPRPGPTYDVWGFGCICYTVIWLGQWTNTLLIP
jgi:serine/threonine protein kinase